ncbi:MAG: glycosyltransferase family 39 protein [Anaerolineae bacterium]|nr:glycosyltransferase family 39 protein [Anaerolineae bacterium]
MVDYLARNGFQLPIQNAANVGIWRQEGSQPPLYYMLAAALIAGVDRSDLAEVRRQNPHADIGIVRPDGNANMMVPPLNWGTRTFEKTLLSVQIVRLFSIVLGLGTVLLTYAIARELFPNDPYLALVAAGLNAFLPMFLFISASVNNDNLSNLLGNLLTLLTIRLFKMRAVPRWQTFVVMGSVLGCGLLAKLNLVFWLPVLAGGLLITSLRLGSWRVILVGSITIIGLASLIAGWWYIRNWQLYSDPTGINVFLEIVGRRAIPANIPQLWSERFSFTQSFWGFFGGMNVAMPVEVYSLLDAVGLAGLIGSLVFLMVMISRRRYAYTEWMAVGITIIWPLVTFLSLLRWTAETPASQGRLIFGALSSICVWIVVGVFWWQPKRLRSLTTKIFLLGLFALAVSAPFLFVLPSYASPIQAVFSESILDRFFEPVTSGEIQLVRVNVLTPQVRPEMYAEIESVWQVAKPLTRDWSLFVHLVTADGVIIAQRDVFPGQGRLATSMISAEYAWENPIAIWLPENTYAPQVLTIQIGWYHLESGDRLVLPDGSTSTSVGFIQLLPRASSLDVPNPISINFAHQIELVGYELTTLSPRVEQEVELTLYWRRVQPITTNFTVFAHILNPMTQTLYAGSDSQPAEGTRPTTTWEEGEVIADTHRLWVRPDATPGTYELEIGVYTQTPDGGFSRLRVVTGDGGMASDFAYLSRIRIDTFQESDTSE